ncbi:MAG: hypothetical protein AB8B82_02790 [Roseovarius sp.]
MKHIALLLTLALPWPTVIAAQDTMLSVIADQKFEGRLVSDKHGDSGPMWIVDAGAHLIIRYDDLDCEGRLDLITEGHNTAVFRETITGKARWCWESGTVRLTRAGATSVQFGWSIDADTPVTLGADLVQVVYGPTPDADQIAEAMNLYMQNGFSAFEGLLQATHDMPAGMLVDCTRDGCNFMDIAKVSISVTGARCTAVGDRQAECSYDFAYAQNMQDWVGQVSSAILDGMMSLQAPMAATARFNRTAEGWYIPSGQIVPVQ